ncbi:hypothetical protein DY000_02001458 [Brassica cretica]|uniref:AAA+ ATPase domain-containing protein n=1 Tax=Brassica cretica TaxID=69181 RepID=A0ABQ7BV18_BRACR|nr:hypothetical protein DY000_02001458 [Brassica cretica]
MKMIQFRDKKNHIAEVLAANDIQCDDLASICHADTMCLSNHIEQIVVSAISYHLIQTKEPEYRNGKLVISSKSLSHGLSIFQEGGSRSSEDSLKLDTNTDSKGKEGELVMLPLRRPDLFKGGLLKPCRGILLFGPPGTGKTMLAKAIANEAGASFINVSMSTITSKWFGEDEKNVRALFTLAAKVSPTIIFVDEVDSMLGQRTRVGEHEAMRKIKNEFMTHWDGLMTKPGERILVLAATNRPFDLDEAIIRRIMVGLPSTESREKILRTLLSKEKTDDLDFHELGQMTEGYSGSDLKNLCITAAYRPVRELIQQERLKDQERKKREEAGKSAEESKDKEDEACEEKEIILRPLNMEDMRKAKNQVAASFASEGSGMNELKQWNDFLSHGLSIFQEGGSRSFELDTNTDSKRKGGEVCSKSESKPESSGPENKNELEKSLPSNKNDNPSPPKAPEVVPDNEFEKRIRPEVIPANEIGVTFADIGSLDETKDSLQELVMLPLRRPDLFKGGLLKPCRGILLFGPPGTGKTMLAKAIANEAGASFINVSMSTITSKWFGEDEKNVRALFTLAAKVSPTIIFVDEVDSMLGQRTRVGEHEAMRKIKNEFMTHWDGLMTKPGERILVLAATNRPFDLDEAIIRRIMVGLPSIESREKILRTLLSKEKTDELDFHELGQMTEGYSGSDLKNLCITAAYRPVRELIQQERLKDQERKKREEAGKGTEETKEEEEEEASEEREIVLRPLNMEDMRKAKNQVGTSFASEGSGMNELKQWNDLYGEGGSRKKEQLTYFL